MENWYCAPDGSAKRTKSHVKIISHLPNQDENRESGLFISVNTFKFN